MLTEFIQRNLNKTVEFLCRTGNGSSSTISMSVQEQQAIAMQNNCKWIGAYRLLLCTESSKHPELVTFCSCCGAVVNFLRNHSLVLHLKQKNQLSEREIIISPGFRSDPFCNYLIALCNKDISLVLEVISYVPLFWDAYLLLVEITSKFIFIEGPLSPYFYMLLKVKKDIDPPDCVADFVKGVHPSLDALPYEIQLGDLNLLGAFLYAHGHTDAACIIFEKIFFGRATGTEEYKYKNECKTRIVNENSINHTIQHNTFVHPPHAYCTAMQALVNKKAKNDMKIEELIRNVNDRLEAGANNNKIEQSGCCTSYEYADIAAYIFSSKDNPRLLCLIELLKMDHPGHPETWTARGIYQSSLADHKKARYFFKKSLQLQPSIDVMSMLAHTHIHLSEKNEAIDVFSGALRMAPPNFRLLYSVSQGYFRLRMFEQALFYARQALQSKSDGAVWKLVGRVHLHLQDYSAGAHALHKAVRMGEVDALLYLADLYKRLGRHERVAEFYEQYIQIGERNRNTVLAYLVEYFKERGDVTKSNLYREMML